MTANPLDDMPNANTTPEAWVNWYSEVTDYFGRSVGDQLWIRAWGIYGGPNSTANTAALRDAMAKNDIKIDASGTSEAFDSVRHAVTGVGDYLGSIFQMGKWAAFGVVGIGIIGLGIFVWGLAKDPNKTIQTGTKAAAIAG